MSRLPVLRSLHVWVLDRLPVPLASRLEGPVAALGCLIHGHQLWIRLDGSVTCVYCEKEHER